MSSPRTAAPIPFGEKHGEQQQTKSAWFQFLKSIATFKGDLTSITAPPFLLAPESMVEYSTFFAEHPSLFVAPAREVCAEKRALLVLRWFLSGLKHQHAVNDDDGKKKKLKPLNPFLGEIFLGRWIDEAGTTELVSEQVSHHPPATAFKIWNAEHGVHLEGHIAPKAYFSSTVNIERRGYGLMHLDQHDEDHLFTMPRVHVEGLMTFQITPELGGPAFIRSSSGYVSRIEFTSRGWVKGKSNSFVAKLCRADDDKNPLYVVEGQWSGSYTIRDVRTDAVEVVDLTSLKRTPLQVSPVENQHPLESRRAWQHVFRAIQSNDIVAVAQAKNLVENAQRALRKHEKASGQVWQSRYFTRVDTPPILDSLAVAGGDGGLRAACYPGTWKFDDDKYNQSLTRTVSETVMLK